MEQTVYLSLGSNIEPSLFYLQKALKLLAEHFSFSRVSSVYKTAPRDDGDQKDFYNLCALFFTSLEDPYSILGITQEIEKTIGRQKEKGRPKGPRAIDIDILLFGSCNMREKKLSIPHAAMLERNFVLIPLKEIALEYDEVLIKEFNLERHIRENSGQKVEKLIDTGWDF